MKFVFVIPFIVGIEYTASSERRHAKETIVEVHVIGSGRRVYEIRTK